VSYSAHGSTPSFQHCTNGALRLTMSRSLTDRATVVRGLVVTAAILTWVFTFPLLLDKRLASIVGRDFAHFYTIGRVALERKTDILYDSSALRMVQASLVPQVGDALYPPLYPPQTALLFAPLSMLSFTTASALWAILSAALYVAVVFTTWQRLKREIPDGVFVCAAALAFPPFWYLILFRQNSIIVLAAFWAGWLALEVGRPFVAGVAFGCLALKPQFAIVLVPLLLVRREWRLVQGIALSVAVQVLAVVAFLGPTIFVDYIRYLPRLLQRANDVEPVLYKSVSLRALLRLLPDVLTTPLWIISAIVVFALVHRAWRDEIPARVRLGIVVMGTVLVNPHMYVYDAVVLAPALLWLGAWYVDRDDAARFGMRLLVLALAFWSLIVVSVAFGSSGGVVAMAVTVLLLVGVFGRAVVDVSHSSVRMPLASTGDVAPKDSIS
jgi:hypothetical protein